MSALLYITSTSDWTQGSTVLNCMLRLKVHSRAIELVVRLVGLLPGLVQGADMIEANLADLRLPCLIEQVLPFRSAKYTEDLCEKLLSEGIAAAEDLLKASKEALETKLSTHASFNFIEMADALSLRSAIDPSCKSDREQLRSRSRRGRSRTPRRGRCRSFHNRRGGRNRGGFHNRSRPHRRGRDQNVRPERNGNENKEKPALWAACERNDAAVVGQLLSEGKDTEETFQGWTPLMKAAEENATDCLELLLQKKANIEACNRKGRTALSFAAAPSRNNTDGKNRPTACAALRILLKHSADARRKDKKGNTAKDHAVKASREDAIEILEEYQL